LQFVPIEFHPDHEIPDWMNAADVFGLPSLNEGCPNVLLEALACGTKVVASRVGGVPDIIDTPEKGWLHRAWGRQVGKRTPGNCLACWRGRDLRRLNGFLFDVGGVQAVAEQAL
jgi:glycosyltransferase involved in cell wall biosynthesis